MILNESVTLDPEIKKLLDEYVTGTYSFDEDGVCNVVGSVDLSKQQFTKLPVKFGIVSGGFRCSINKLTSLEGAPREVGGSFNCCHNLLTSLEGAPLRVGGRVKCSDNQLESLKGAPEEVEGNFECYNNPKLTYRDLFVLFGKVKGEIVYGDNILNTHCIDKDKLRRDRDVNSVLSKHDELGNLDI